MTGEAEAFEAEVLRRRESRVPADANVPTGVPVSSAATPFEPGRRSVDRLVGEVGGQALDAADSLREVFQEMLSDEPALRRIGALIGGADIRYPMPGEHSLTGVFAPDLALHTDQGTTSVAELMHAGRPVFLDLAERPELREISREWAHLIDLRAAKTDEQPADALLIRPDGHIVWAATIGEPADTAAPTLREALSQWFGSADGA